MGKLRDFRDRVVKRRPSESPEIPSSHAVATIETEYNETVPLISKPTAAAASLVRQSSGVAAIVQERLAKEVLRKLQLAAEADEKDTRDVVCSEVFADITGELNAAARESTGTIYRRWYEVLAPYFCKTPTSSESVLHFCRQLWGQPFTAPIFALLLHQWLLVHPDAGGADQRLKHLNILLSGARQLFLGDVETGSTAFHSLFSFFSEQTVLAVPRTRLDGLPAPAREGIIAIAAAFLPNYSSPEDVARSIQYFPPPVAASPESSSSSPSGAGEGADFVIDRIVDILGREIRSEAAVLRYLTALTALRDSSCLKGIRTATRVRLQGELYALTQPGGPKYASRAVNKAAFRALDALFPLGRRTRRLINLAFRFLHPQEWPWVWFDAYKAVLGAALAWTVAAWVTAVEAVRRTVSRIGMFCGGGSSSSSSSSRQRRQTSSSY